MGRQRAKAECRTTTWVCSTATIVASMSSGRPPRQPTMITSILIRTTSTSASTMHSTTISQNGQLAATPSTTSRRTWRNRGSTRRHLSSWRRPYRIGRVSFSKRMTVSPCEKKISWLRILTIWSESPVRNRLRAMVATPPRMPWWTNLHRGGSRGREHRWSQHRQWMGG